MCIPPVHPAILMADKLHTAGYHASDTTAWSEFIRIMQILCNPLEKTKIIQEISRNALETTRQTTV